MEKIKVQKLGENTIISTEVTKVPGTTTITLRISLSTISTFLEKPHTAPSRIPMVKLIRAQISAMEIEIRAPYHRPSKVDWPDSPVPNSQWMLKPNFWKA